jgi:hypothetical protein
VHEHWDYDDATGVQALRQLLALCRGCHASTHYGLAEVQGRDGEAFAIGIILVVIGVILAILAAPAPAIAGRRHFFRPVSAISGAPCGGERAIGALGPVMMRLSKPASSGVWRTPIG